MVDSTDRIAAIAQEIEAQLDRIPKRDVPVAPVSPIVPVPDVWRDWSQLPEGEHACAICGATVERPGVCDACCVVVKRREYEAIIKHALSTIPESYMVPDDVVTSRVKAKLKHDAMKVAAMAGASYARGAIMVTTFRGAGRSGKSTLAAAVMRGLIQAAEEHHMRHVDPVPSVRGGAMPRTEPPAVALARGALWVDAIELWEDGRRTPRAIQAEECPFLVLDDVGQETTERGPIADVTKKVILMRFKARRPMLITTGFNDKDIVRVYGEGMRGRLLDPPARVVLFGESC